VVHFFDSPGGDSRWPQVVKRPNLILKSLSSLRHSLALVDNPEQIIPPFSPRVSHRFNVHSMPDTLPRPEAAGPSFPVKRLAFHHDKNIGVSPSTTAWASSITAPANGVTETQSNDQDLLYFGRRASTFGDHSPLLSERESIFATHYTPAENDSSTPRLPPLAGAVIDASTRDTLESNMEFSLPPLVPTPSKLSVRSSLTASRMGSGAIAGGLKQSGHTGSEKSADSAIPASNATIRGIRRVSSDGHPWAKSFHVHSGHSSLIHGLDQPQARLDEPAIADDTAQTEANATQQKEEQEHRHGQVAQRQSAMSQAIQQNRPERSVSRGRAHVDKSIEATLTNAEPGQNIRSRKSSHLMGVFRENTSSLESKQREANILHTDEGDISQTISRPSIPSGRTYSRPTPATATDANPASPESKPQPSALTEQDKSFASKPDQSHDGQPLLSEFSTTPKVLLSPAAQPKSPSKHEHDPYFRKQDAIKQSKSSHVPPIPPSLLEQIREHHNLVPMRGQGAHLPKDRTGFTSHEDTDLADRRQLRTRDIGGQTDESEEHISSAIYFPHPVPMEDLDQLSSSEEGQLLPGAQAEIGAPVPAGVPTHNDLKRPSIDLAPAEHIDISVQSKHEKRVFHGDYQPPDDVQVEELDRDILPTIRERPAESFAIASDSEVESGDDIGAASQTDDDVTPTATPIPTSPLRRRKRPPISTGPTGAVQLEPYSHQVGGHSTIFRFSRRAVCKQLNNRENEFYERIERRHPDMLRFLPRFVLSLSLLPLTSLST
jgi:inositol-hexakisphosphate kinase